MSRREAAATPCGARLPGRRVLRGIEPAAAPALQQIVDAVDRPPPVVAGDQDLRPRLTAGDRCLTADTGLGRFASQLRACPVFRRAVRPDAGKHGDRVPVVALGRRRQRRPDRREPGRGVVRRRSSVPLADRLAAGSRAPLIRSTYFCNSATAKGTPASPGDGEDDPPGALAVLDDGHGGAAVRRERFRGRAQPAQYAESREAAEARSMGFLAPGLMRWGKRTIFVKTVTANGCPILKPFGVAGNAAQAHGNPAATVIDPHCFRWRPACRWASMHRAAGQAVSTMAALSPLNVFWRGPLDPPYIAESISSVPVPVPGSSPACCFSVPQPVDLGSHGVDGVGSRFPTSAPRAGKPSGKRLPTPLRRPLWQSGSEDDRHRRRNPIPRSGHPSRPRPPSPASAGSSSACSAPWRSSCTSTAST